MVCETVVVLVVLTCACCVHTNPVRTWLRNKLAARQGFYKFVQVLSEAELELFNP